MEEKAVETEQAKMYTQEEVDEIVRKAIRQERELLCQVMRGMPDLDATTKQGWIENPTAVSTALSQGFSPPCIVDLDADPFVPDGWKVVKHVKGGQLEFDPAKVALYLDEEQNGGVIIGHELRGKLKGKPVFNANLLDYLLAHPNLIPEEWKGKAVFFWGTIYRDSVGSLCVRCLVWDDGRWYWVYRWLDGRFDDFDPAAVPASN